MKSKMFVTRDWPIFPNVLEIFALRKGSWHTGAIIITFKGPFELKNNSKKKKKP